MKKVCIVILNYMTYDLTITLIQQLRELDFNEDIIVIDNDSPNESYFELMKVQKKYNIILEKSRRNLGYATGNNIGLKMAVALGYEMAMIANNDIIFEDKESIYRMYDIFKKNTNVGSVTPRIVDSKHTEVEQYIYRPSVFDWSFGIFRYKNHCMKATREQKNEFFEIYRPQGCCMLLNAQMLKEINYLDERTFLYFEENILAEKMIDAGYKSYCCSNAKVIHNHSVTTSKCLHRLRKLKIYCKSGNIYMKYFRNWCLYKRMLCLSVKGISMMRK